VTGLTVGLRSPGPPGPGELTIETRPADDVVIVVLRGEIDLASAGALERALHAAEAGQDRLVVDLGGLSFIDSTGIHVLLEAQRRTDGRLSLRRGPEDIHRVFELTRAADYFVFEDGPAREGQGSQASPAPSPRTAVSGRPTASPSG
jgi:anti-sigma B factor antagonist